jgi:ribonuclease HI
MSQSTFDVIVHTDGACSGNPGPGGWAAVLMAGEHKKEIAGRKPHATNNEMELMAVLEALKALKRTGLSVAIYTDSQLVVGLLAGDHHTKKPHLQAIVRDIKTVAEGKYLALDFFHVKAHSGNPGNERANKLAQNEVRIAKRAAAKQANRALLGSQ